MLINSIITNLLVLSHFYKKIWGRVLDEVFVLSLFFSSMIVPIKMEMYLILGGEKFIHSVLVGFTKIRKF